MDEQTNTNTKKSWTHQADNRARLIEAGYSILAEKGIEATTVKEIARRASVSPGLFHYYFASKDELLLAVFQEAGTTVFVQQLAQELQQRLSEQTFPEVAMLAVGVISRRNPTWFRLRYELYALGLRNPTFLPAVGLMLEKVRASIAQTLSRYLGGDDAQLQAMAAVILACTDGLALQQLAQPEIDFTPAYRQAQKLLLSGREPA